MLTHAFTRPLPKRWIHTYAAPRTLAAAGILNEAWRQGEPDRQKAREERDRRRNERRQEALRARRK
jgi:hypothetical protein